MIYFVCSEVAMAKSAVEKSCGAVVVKRKGSKIFVLIVRQMEGHWGFPKGHMKDYEYLELAGSIDATNEGAHG